MTILDTAVASMNLGDEIIMEDVDREVKALFSDAFVYRVATHEIMGRRSRTLLRHSDVAIVGGTNCLTSRFWFIPTWRLMPWDGLWLRGLTLLGAGWHAYQRKPDPYSRYLLRAVLSHETLHSVRDQYTVNRLEELGFRNVVNTGCPTLWNLTPDHCARIPHEKAQNAVCTVNTSNPDPGRDQQLIRTVRKCYQKVFFWPQKETDLTYSREFDPGLEYLDPSLDALDELLSSSLDLDYVGIRLHAGLRALQKGRRAIIVSIDNRATEMGRDFGLHTVERDSLEELEAAILSARPTDLRLPVEAIERWRAQFRR